MYVIMDIEWYEGKNCAFVTQLSALRIDGDYNILDRCDFLVEPIDGVQRKRIDWNHLAFSGHAKTEFFTGYPLFMVLDQFKQWLHKEDIMIWWHPEQALNFLKNGGSVILQNQTSRIVWKQFRELLPQERKRGMLKLFLSQILKKTNCHNFS